MSFDLKIANYSKNELIEMFDLPVNYDKNIVEIKETKLRESIMNNKSINKDTRDNTLNFLNEAKNILFRNAHDNSSNNYSKKEVEGINETNKILQSIAKINSNDSSVLKKTPIESPQEHMVQEKTGSAFSLSFPSNSYSGILNPLKRRTRRENLVIDTRFRENYYNSSPTNFNFQLPMIIENVVEMQLTALELPATYYIISKQYNNNFFTIKVNEKSRVITIPDGNYDYDSLQIVINDQIHKLDGDFKFINFFINITTINGKNSGSGQMMVGIDSSAPQGQITQIELNFQADRHGYDDRNTPLPLKLGWLLGFRNGIYTNNLNYVSESVVDIVGPKYFYLVIDDFNNNVNNGLFYGAFNSSLLNKNIISRISLTSNNFNTIFQNNFKTINDAREYFGPVNIRNFQIQLLDEYGRVVDLNYMDFSFCLTMTIIYDI